MSSSLLGLLLLVLITLTAGVLWALSRWISVRLAGPGASAGAGVRAGAGVSAPFGRPGAEPSLAGQLRSDATVPAARLRRGRPAPYPLGDRTRSERVVAGDMRSPSSRYEELSSLATVDALPPAAGLDASILRMR